MADFEKGLRNVGRRRLVVAETRIPGLGVSAGGTLRPFQPPFQPQPGTHELRNHPSSLLRSARPRHLPLLLLLSAPAKEPQDLKRDGLQTLFGERLYR